MQENRRCGESEPPLGLLTRPQDHRAENRKASKSRVEYRTAIQRFGSESVLRSSPRRKWAKPSCSLVLQSLADFSGRAELGVKHREGLRCGGMDCSLNRLERLDNP
jgi:hypothetical protein